MSHTALSAQRTPLMYALVLAAALWQVRPVHAGPQHPKHRVHKPPIIISRATNHAQPPSKQRLHTPPLYQGLLSLIGATEAGTRIWIAAGVTDMRWGFQGLAAQVQTALEQQPYSGYIFIFRGRRGDMVKLLWFDGGSLCLFQKRLELERFVWPQTTSGTVSLSRALDVARRH